MTAASVSRSAYLDLVSSARFFFSSYMHAIDLARLAAVAAAHAPTMLLIRPAVSPEAMVGYWTQARQRFDLWHRGLGRFTELENAGRSVAIRDWWQEHLPMIEEILVSETLTRVMAAVGSGLDIRRACDDVSPITQSVFVTHLEARNRVLRLLLFGRGGSAEDAMRLNRLRRCVERWTDFLLGPLLRQHPPAGRYTHDSARAQSFAEDAAQIALSGDTAAVSRLTLAALETSLSGMCRTEAALPQANRQLAQAVLACFRPECFDSLGLLKSARLQRLTDNESPEAEPIPTAGRDGHLLFHAPQPKLPAPHLVRWCL